MSGDGDRLEQYGERTDYVLLVECSDLTVAEYEAVVTALKTTLLPLSLAQRIRLHAAIRDTAERVMDAFDGRQTNGS